MVNIKKIILLIIMLSINNSWAAKPINKIAATVGEEIITTQELTEKTDIVIDHLSKQNIALPPKASLQHQVLNKMILDKIQLQLAKDFAIEVDSTDINNTIKDLAKRDNLSLAEYRNRILKEGLTFEDFREQIKTELTLARLQQREISNEIRISNAEIEGYLNSREGQDQSGVEYHLGHILVESEAKALEIVKELQQAEKDFKQYAARFSRDMKALDGGNLGWRKLKEIPTIFVKQVPDMQVNEVIGPIKSASGFHIIKLYGKRFGKKEDRIELKLRQILIADKEDAQNRLLNFRNQLIENKKQFATLAKDYSEEQHTASRGGELGWVVEQDVLPDFWSNIVKLSVNQISQPFKTSLGWHLVQVSDKRRVNLSKEAMRNQAIEILRERKFNEALELWLQKIRDEARVDVLL